MSETHTPGPWTSQRYGPAEENAHLIAAAPDLLAALREVAEGLNCIVRSFVGGRGGVRAGDEPECDCDACERARTARAAIAAAEGREVTG